jgi:hypothetical protein
MFKTSGSSKELLGTVHNSSMYRHVACRPLIMKLFFGVLKNFLLSRSNTNLYAGLYCQEKKIVNCLESCVAEYLHTDARWANVRFFHEIVQRGFGVIFFVKEARE